LVKERRTKRASPAEANLFKSKAHDFFQMMERAIEEERWDVAVSNGIQALMLMANAITIFKVGEYYVDKDHAAASDYLGETVGQESRSAVSQMKQVMSKKTAAEYDSHRCTERDALDVKKRVDPHKSYETGRMHPLLCLRMH
jgi:HEPN domain-containing protein